MTTPWQPPDPDTPAQPPIVQPPAASPPPPRYGELAPPGYAPWTPEPTAAAVPTAPPAYYAPPPVERKPRTADVVVTSILLVLGLVGMLAGVISGLELGPGLAMEYAKYGIHYSAPANLGALSALIIVSHVVLFLVALGVSIPLVIKRRVAFWVPLTAGVIAGAILWITLIALVAGDPSLMSAISASQR